MHQNINIALIAARRWKETNMGLFKKKKIYKVIWAFDSLPMTSTHTEYVKAKDEADAWYKIATQHYAIDCRSISLVEATPTETRNRII